MNGVLMGCYIYKYLLNNGAVFPTGGMPGGPTDTLKYLSTKQFPISVGRY
jgi:hypothetical protein